LFEHDLRIGSEAGFFRKPVPTPDLIRVGNGLSKKSSQRVDRNWKLESDSRRLWIDGGEKDRTMPWTHDDAEKHTHKATTPALKELWAKVANESLDRTGDEGRAVREANAVVARQAEAR
jgi:hypothetical protein